MKYVNTIRRIAMLSKALHRSQNADHDDHYEDRIFDAEDRIIAKTLRAEAKRSYPTRVKIANFAFRLHL